MKLRAPADRLVDTCWLPRFVDKARLSLAGELPKDYADRFCDRRSIDGVFLHHFELNRESIIEAVRVSEKDDARMGEWFLTQPGVTAATISSWNQLGPLIGKPGQRGHEIFRSAIKERYPDAPYTGVESAFEVIDADEGRK